MKREVCKLAKEMADQYGGRPADYMKDAWEIVKESVDYKEPSKKKEVEKVSFWGWAAKTAGAYAGKKILSSGKKGMKKGKQGIKRGVERGANDLNFLKAPKDKPSDVMPDGMKDYFKNTFRLK